MKTFKESWYRCVFHWACAVVVVEIHFNFVLAVSMLKEPYFWNDKIWFRHATSALRRIVGVVVGCSPSSDVASNQTSWFARSSLEKLEIEWSFLSCSWFLHFYFVKVFESTCSWTRWLWGSVWSSRWGSRTWSGWSRPRSWLRDDRRRRSSTSSWCPRQCWRMARRGQWQCWRGWEEPRRWRRWWSRWSTFG